MIDQVKLLIDNLVGWVEEWNFSHLSGENQNHLIFSVKPERNSRIVLLAAADGIRNSLPVAIIGVGVCGEISINPVKDNIRLFHVETVTTNVERVVPDLQIIQDERIDQFIDVLMQKLMDNSPDSKPPQFKVRKARKGGPVPMSDDDQKAIIAEWLEVEGNETQEHFCMRKSIGASTLRKWRRNWENLS